MIEKVFEGKTLEEAKLKAIEELGIAEEKLDYEVTEKPNKLLSLIMNSGYKIKVMVDEEVVKPALPETNVAPMAKELILKIVRFIDPAANIEIFDRGEEVTFNILSNKGNILIGRNGDTLNALQYLVIKMLNRKGPVAQKILVDIDGYIRRKRKKLIDMARQMVVKVKQVKKPISLEPMSSTDRWIIHNELASENGIVTRSFGEGRDRRVIIIPNKFKDMEEKLLLKYFKPMD
jgi:spoIIIJ-associated protein